MDSFNSIPDEILALAIASPVILFMIWAAVKTLRGEIKGSGSATDLYLLPFIILVFPFVWLYETFEKKPKIDLALPDISREEAIQRLESQGIHFSNESFISYLPSLEKTKLFLAGGIDPNAIVDTGSAGFLQIRDSSGFFMGYESSPETTALIEATESKEVDLSIIEMLLQNGADAGFYFSKEGFNGKNYKNSKEFQYYERTFRSALKEALIADKPLLVDLFIQYGMDFQKEFKPFFLFEIIEQEKYESYQYVAKRGVDFAVTDPLGNTLLHTACTGRRTAVKSKIIQDLLERGLDPNTPNKAGETPLSLLAGLRRQEYSNEPQILDDLKHLFEKGANPSRKNSDGKNAHMIARENEKFYNDQPLSLYFSGDLNLIGKAIRKRDSLRRLYAITGVILVIVFTLLYLFGPTAKPLYHK